MKRKEFDTVHTKPSFWIIIISCIIQFSLGFTYIGSVDSYEYTFGMITMIEAIFAIVGIFLIDPISGYSFKLYPKKFRPINENTGIHFIITFIGLIGTQYLINIPLTVRDIEIASAIIFAAPAEEVIFRGVILTMFIQLSQFSSYTKIRISKEREIGIFDVLGIIISSLIFMMIHINYYNNPQLMATIFLCGVVLALSYWIFNDLTAITMAHLMLNIIVVYQTFYMVYI